MTQLRSVCLSTPRRCQRRAAQSERQREHAVGEFDHPAVDENRMEKVHDSALSSGVAALEEAEWRLAVGQSVLVRESIKFFQSSDFCVAEIE